MVGAPPDLINSSPWVCAVGRAAEASGIYLAGSIAAYINHALAGWREKRGEASRRAPTI